MQMIIIINKEENNMPGYDRTGPRGMGPMTGGGRGLCRLGYARRRFPRWGRCFFGFGRGMGRGWGVYEAPEEWYSAPSTDEERSILKEELSMLENEMEHIRKRIAELEENK